MRKFVITAAGGNATAIGVIEEPQSRTWYETTGSALMDEFSELNVEQVGFIVLSQNHFEMSGGELCGNGTRAAGLLFSMLNGSVKEFTFTTSGHTGEVRVEISDGDSENPYVKGFFPNLSGAVQSVTTSVGEAKLVDLGGIVHVIIAGDMPEDYVTTHRAITKELGLTDRGAVGVDWVRENGESVAMDPVVWVNSIDTYFYETSCGSGSISTALATGIKNVKQPSGQTIVVGNDDGVMTIASPLEVVHGS